MSKANQRLEYGRLSEVLAERGLVEPQALREALQFSTQGNMPFPEALVSANLVQDWELSRVVCEIYNLPFLSVDMVDPDPKALEGIDPQLLIDNAIIPIGRFGQVLTVCMPALVPASCVFAKRSSFFDSLMVRHPDRGVPDRACRRRRRPLPVTFPRPPSPRLCAPCRSCASASA